jgi:hypothetical protein
MAGALLGFVLAFGAPIGLSYAASGLVSASVNVVLFADPANADLAADRLRYLSFISSNNLDRLVWAYEGETESSRKEELKRRYKRITGNDIEARLQLLKD